MKNVMVTGAAGFIGYALALDLAKKGDVHVIAVDNFVRGENDEAYNELCNRDNVSNYEVDLNNLSAVSTLPADCDVIFHLAAMNGTQNFYERPYDVIRCCTLPTFNLLEQYASKGNLKRFLYAGSSEAYACTVTEFDWPVPTTEDVPLCISDPENPRWSYGASKLHGEVLVVNACRQFGCDYTVIRYHNAYGPRMGDRHVIPDFLQRMKEEKYELYGYKDTRSFIYIDDAVRATRELAMADAGANQIVNVGGDREIKMLDLGQEILKLAKVEAEIQLNESPAGSVSRRAPDTTKLQELIDFKPSWSLSDGLVETMNFYL